MKMKKLLALSIAVALIAIIAACGGGASGPQATDQKVVEPVKEMSVAEQMELGRKIYETPGKCITCHMADGKGIEGAFPSLIGSAFLLETPVLAVSQLLNGSDKVAAERSYQYPAPMPAQLTSKAEAVAVTNYVLNNFGNDGGFITLEDVKDVVILPAN
jgi:nitrite reductase (NO-forming)